MNIRFNMLICVCIYIYGIDILQITVSSSVHYVGLSIPSLIFKDQNVAKHSSYLHDKHDFIFADKAHYTIVCVRKSHYINFLINELCIENVLGKWTYSRTTHTIDEILDIHLFYVPLEHITVLLNNSISLGLQSAKKSLFLN